MSSLFKRLRRKKRSAKSVSSTTVTPANTRRRTLENPQDDSESSQSYRSAAHPQQPAAQPMVTTTLPSSSVDTLVVKPQQPIHEDPAQAIPEESGSSSSTPQETASTSSSSEEEEEEETPPPSPPKSPDSPIPSVVCGPAATTVIEVPSPSPQDPAVSSPPRAVVSPIFETPKDIERKPEATSIPTVSTVASDQQSCDEGKEASEDDDDSYASSSASSVKEESVQKIARAAAALDDVGNKLFEKGDFDKAMSTYSRALKLKQRTLYASNNNSNMLASVATSMNNITYLQQRSGRISADETMNAYIKSLSIKRKILGKNSLSVGKTLNNIGSVHYLKQDYGLALAAYQNALEIMKENLGEDHVDVGTVLSNIGDVYLAGKETELSLDFYRRALDIRWNALGEHDPKVVRLLQKVAALEMGDQAAEPEPSQTSIEDDDLESSAEEPAVVEQELHLLHDAVEEDIHFIDLMERKMAIDMIKDKIQILRGMRAIEEGRIEDLGDEIPPSHEEEPEEEQTQQPVVPPVSSPTASPRMNPDQRHEALLEVRARLAKLRAQKAANGIPPLTDPGSRMLSPKHRTDLKGGIAALQRLQVARERLRVSKATANVMTTA